MSFKLRNTRQQKAKAKRLDWITLGLRARKAQETPRKP